MTEESYLRTGQVAQRLGRSSYEIRKLLEFDLIQGEYTGSQWRIPVKEVDRLEREGVPDIPVSLPEPDDEPDHWEPPDDSAALSPSPSAEVVEATDEVSIEEAHVKTARHRLERRKIERELAETEDFFQERQDRERERKANEQLKAKSEADEKQRTEWRDSWLSYAKASIPREADPDALWLEVYPLVWAALEKLRPTPARHVTESVVDAIVSKALIPWRNLQQMRGAMDKALTPLPWGLRNDSIWYDRAVRAVAEAISEVGVDASLLQQETAAARAGESIKKEFEEAARREEIVRWVILSDATTAENEDARDAVRKALAGVPVGASERQVQAARDAGLVPFRTKIKGREDKKMREGLLGFWNLYPLSSRLPKNEMESLLQRIRNAFAQLPEGTPRPDLEAARDRLIAQEKRKIEQQEAKSRLIEDGLREIGPCLRKLQEVGWEFDDSLSSLESELKAPIRKALESALTGTETAEQIQKLLRRLVRREMDCD